MASGNVILETKGLTRRFGGLVAVDHVDFSLSKGEVRAIIGPNGAGKTTLFNLIAGVIKPTSGSVYLRGQDITHLPAHERVKLGLGRSFQIVNICHNLLVRQNVEIATQAALKRTTSPWEVVDRNKVRVRAAEILEDFGLADDRHLRAGCLAYGHQRKLELALALALEPEILLLDEPAAGADERGISEIVRLIREVASHRTVLLTDHDVKFVMSIADTITVLDQGRIIAEGCPSEIARSRTVQQAYLGVIA